MTERRYSRFDFELPCLNDALIAAMEIWGLLLLHLNPHIQRS
ncbi:hypothetical protein [Phyllobacterium phragmitis]|nr:hypothetical protein [Phyllobacterium phragmitis]